MTTPLYDQIASYIRTEARDPQGFYELLFETPWSELSGDYTTDRVNGMVEEVIANEADEDLDEYEYEPGDEPLTWAELDKIVTDINKAIEFRSQCPNNEMPEEWDDLWFVVRP